VSKFQSHSRYWLGTFADDDSVDLASKGITTSEIIRLASIKNAISNFVRIVTKRPIPVKFNSGKDSYTDGDMVVISATTKEKTFDAVVGLALHESTHCVWREFPDFLQKYALYNNHMIPQSLKDKCEDVNITTKSRGKLQVSQLAMMLKNLMNTFEDRRIDWWLYRTAPGYRPYYEALYKQYWHSTQIDYALQQGKWNVPTVESYINLLINMTNPWFDTRALPDLNLMYGMIDVDHINRFDNDKGYKYVNRQYELASTEYSLDKMPEIFQLAVQVMSVILDNCLPMPEQEKMQACPAPDRDPDSTMEDNLDMNQSTMGGGGVPGMPEDDDSDDDSDESDNESGGDSDDDAGGAEGDEDKKEDSSKGSHGEDESEDSDGDADSKDDQCKDKHGDEPPKKPGKLNDKKLEKALEKQRQFLDGNVQKKKVTKKLDNQVKAIEQSGASEVEVSHSDDFGGTHKTKVLVLRKFTRAILESGTFPFTPGMTLDRRRGSYGDDWVIRTPHRGWKPTTDYHSEKAVEEGFRMGNVLAHRLQIRNMKRITRFTRRDRGNIERRRLHAIGAGDTSVFFKDKTTKFSPVLAHMSLDASSSMTGEKWTRALSVGIAVAVAASKIKNLDFVLSMRAGVGPPCMAIIYDSRVDKPMKIKQLFPYLTTIGNTPEGLCFAAIMDDLLSERHGDRFFINLSDGQPWYNGYTGQSAWKHTREQVNILRGSGLKVLSYFISYRDNYGWGSDSSKQGFETMYGKDAQFIDVKRITTLARTLNRLFLIR
jgi:hypothetical protein